MIVIVIILGLIGLGIVVLVHELGHFAAAKASGVEVEAFSIGWGPKIWGWKRGATEWRISAFPIGGYCKMKGEEALTSAIQNKTEHVPRDPGTFYGVSPWKRILISFSGPLANIIFAIVVYIIVAAVGFSEKTYDNRIVLANDFSLGGVIVPRNLPAEGSGLKSGDRIVSINGKRVADFNQLQETIALSPDKNLNMSIERNGQFLDLQVKPQMDKDSGAGRIGIYPWIDPVVDSLVPNGPAALGGMKSGDIITSIDGKTNSPRR